MNKYIEKTLSKYDFKYYKNNGYGHINGYEVNVFNSVMSAGPIFLFSTFISQNKKNDFILKINSYKFPLVQAQAFDYGVAIMIGSMIGKTFEKKFAVVMPKILEILESFEAPKSDICPQSGETIDELDCVLTHIPNSQFKIRMSSKAVAVVNSNIEKSNEDFKNASNNYLKGFIGLLIGGIAGVAATILFSLLGYVTALAPLISIFLGVFLYKKLGGKQNSMMIVMSFVTTAILILGAMMLMYVIVCNNLVTDAGLPYRGFDALSFCLNNSEEFKNLFILDIVLNGLFILIAEGYSIFRLVKMIQRPKNIK